MTTLTRSGIWILTCLSLLSISSTTSAHEIGKVTIPDTLEYADHTLVLNGAGWRTKAILKIYIGSLYLPTPSSDAAAIISADEPMAIQLNILSGLMSKKQMKAALLDGFKKSTGGNTAPIQEGINSLVALMDQKINKKDIYLLAYAPKTGLEVIKNGETIGSVAGLPLKQALFGIWLSDDPVQSKLKQAMLGG